MIARMRWVNGWTGRGNAQVIRHPRPQTREHVFFDPKDCLNWDPEKTRPGTLIVFDSTVRDPGKKMPRVLAWRILRPPPKKASSVG